MSNTSDAFFTPVSGMDLPRLAGIPTFMRLPAISIDDAKIADVDIGLIGVPWDAGTTNRPGPRHGPRQLRDYSTMIRAVNAATGFKPFDLANCADLGDVGGNPADLHDAMDKITAYYAQVKAKGGTFYIQL